MFELEVDRILIVVNCGAVGVASVDVLVVVGAIVQVEHVPVEAGIVHVVQIEVGTCVQVVQVEVGTCVHVVQVEVEICVQVVQVEVEISVVPIIEDSQMLVGTIVSIFSDKVVEVCKGNV